MLDSHKEETQWKKGLHLPWRIMQEFMRTYKNPQ